MPQNSIAYVMTIVSASFLYDMLRDKLVGINDDNIQRRLLAEKDTMMFQETFNIAVVMELASNFLEIQGKEEI